eukprot:364952-Chlamydomonas_euryale.AAC.2
MTGHRSGGTSGSSLSPSWPVVTSAAAPRPSPLPPRLPALPLFPLASVAPAHGLCTALLDAATNAPWLQPPGSALLGAPGVPPHTVLPPQPPSPTPPPAQSPHTLEPLPGSSSSCRPCSKNAMPTSSSLGVIARQNTSLTSTAGLTSTSAATETDRGTCSPHPPPPPMRAARASLPPFVPLLLPIPTPVLLVPCPVPPPLPIPTPVLLVPRPVPPPPHERLRLACASLCASRHAIHPPSELPTRTTERAAMTRSATSAASPSQSPTPRRRNSPLERPWPR